MRSIVRSAYLFGPLTGLVVSAVLLLAPRAAAADGGQAGSKNEAPAFAYSASRVVAVGDVHGAFEALVGLLRANAFLDDQNNWTGGTAHLVSLGDLIDRGARSRDVMDLFQRLQPQAAAVGGRVHVLLGNHEVMNLLGDLRDVSKLEFAAYAAPDSRDFQSAQSPGRPHVEGTETGEPARVRPPGYEEHRAAFASNGTYGGWLLQQPILLRINRTLFTHGGLSPLLGGRSLLEINQQGIDQLNRAISSRAQGISLDEALRAAPLLGEWGPLWYRGSAACHPLLESSILEEQLAQLDADQLVIGHTPTATRTPLSRLQQRVFAIDTGMLASVYRGQPFLLEIEPRRDRPVRVLDDSGEEMMPRFWHPVLALEPQSEATLTLSQIEENGVSGRWLKASERTIRRALARYRLDRQLGLWMTPLVRADVAGKRFFEAVSGRWISERERREAGRIFPNYCVQGHQNLLISAFDALTGVTSRDVDNLYWHRATGAARLDFVKSSFSTATVLPKYKSAPTLPPAFAQRIASLNEAGLTQLLGDLLNPRQIRAILARRDKLLLWPKTELAL